MQPERIPFIKAFDTPFISLDETSVELASILFVFAMVFVVANIKYKRQLWRRLVQVVSLTIFFFFIYSCLGVFGMIRNGLYGMTLLGTVYSESFYWLALPVSVMAITLVMGPIFCSWICPTGTIQEWTLMLRRLIFPKKWMGSRLQLALLGFFLAGFVSLTIYIGIDRQMFVEDSSLHWAASLFLICYLVLLGVLDDLPTRKLRIVSVLAIFVTAISHVTITSPVHFAFTSRNDPASALSTLVLALASMVVARAWCRYVCPWGFVMGFLHRFSRVKVMRNEKACNNCYDCVRICDVGAIDQQGVRHEYCQLCYACIDQCKLKALELKDVWQKETPEKVMSEQSSIS
ncbi:MAG: 4Fe-4S binding protein [Deltaproteobacteria bacterium]|nr:4Fe-4S binding protein [Deltaproteobacteria bacterium]